MVVVGGGQTGAAIVTHTVSIGSGTAGGQTGAAVVQLVGLGERVLRVQTQAGGGEQGGRAGQRCINLTWMSLLLSPISTCSGIPAHNCKQRGGMSVTSLTLYSHVALPNVLPQCHWATGILLTNPNFHMRPCGSLCYGVPGY